MSEERIKALCQSIYNEIDFALNDIVWRDHPQVVESLTNAKELLEVVLEGLSEDPEELNFD